LREKKIKLEELDHSKEFLHETIGISAEEFSEVFWEELKKNKTLEKLIDKLKISLEEIVEISFRVKTISQIAAEIWKRRGKKRISLKTFIQTVILVLSAIEVFRKFKDELRNLIEMVRAEGTEVALGTSDCREWLNSQQSCEECPFILGCQKIFLLYICFSKKAFFFNPLWDLSGCTEREIKKILKATTLEQLEKLFTL